MVTGGGSGIGKTVAVALGAEGANVVVNDLKADVAQSVVDEITAAGGTAVAGDMGKHDDVKAVVDAAVEIDAYLKLMDVNLHSVFYGMHYQLPQIVAAGGGAIVNTSSILGLVGDGLALPYVAAKHGVAGMSKAAAISYATQGVRVNSVHPGYIDTPLLQGMPQEAYDGLVAKHPIGRLGTSEEVAEVVLFLLSDKASFVTGSQYAVDGAYTAQ